MWSGSNELDSSRADIQKLFKLFVVRSRGVSLSMPLAAPERANMMYRRWLAGYELTLV